MLEIENVTAVFPVGTSVGAYTDARFDSGGASPVGVALDTGVVDEDGSLSLDVPSDGTTYALAALVEGEWRVMRRTTTVVPAGESQIGGDALRGDELVYDGTIFAPHGRSILDARNWVGYIPSLSDKGPQLQEALDAARGIGGARLLLPPWTVYTGQTLVTYSLVHLCGHGQGTSVIKLLDGADCDVLTVDEYGAGGIHQASFRDFSVDGNKAKNASGSGILSDGVSLLGENLFVKDCVGNGIDHIQSREPNTARVFGEDDSLWRNCKVDDCESYGIRSNAHDCHFVDVWVCSNAKRNFLVDEEGYATKLARVHSYGAAEYGFEFRASFKAVQCEAEGSAKAQVLLNGDNGHWHGHVFADSDPSTGDGKVGIEWAAGTGFATIIEGRISGCTNGSLKFTGTGSNSKVTALIDQASGKICAGGEPGTNVDFSEIHLTGKAEPNFPVKTVASAGTITIPLSAKVIEVTGKTSITEIDPGRPNQVAILRFREAVTVVDGKNLDLKGNFNAKPEDTLTLVFGVTEWHEVTRSSREGGTMYGATPLVGVAASGASPGGSTYESVLVTVPNRATLTGIAFRVGAEQKNNVRVYLHDAAGNLLAHSSNTAMGEKEKWQRVPFESSVTVEAGNYILTISYASVTSTIWKARMLCPTQTAAGVAEFGILGKIEVPAGPENADRPILVTY